MSDTPEIDRISGLPACPNCKLPMRPAGNRWRCLHCLDLTFWAGTTQQEKPRTDMRR